MDPIETQNCPHCGGACTGWVAIVFAAILLRWLWVLRRTGFVAKKNP